MLGHILQFRQGATCCQEWLSVYTEFKVTILPGHPGEEALSTGSTSCFQWILIFSRVLHPTSCLSYSALLCHRSIHIGSASPMATSVIQEYIDRPPTLCWKQQAVPGCLAGAHARWRGVRGHFLSIFRSPGDAMR